MTLSIKVSDLYLIDKEKIAMGLFNIGMLIAFLGSLNPWFLWKIGTLYPIPAALFIGGILFVSRSMQKKIFSRNDFLLPLMALLVFIVYERLSINSNVNGFIMLIFRAVIFYSLYRISTGYLQQTITFICKVMGALLAVSLAGHILYILGFPMPGGADVQFDEYYSFTNHYLFLLDDRNLLILFPRFNSYFLEPSHIGQACAFLLFTQRGKWKRWYNIVMLATIFFSFSLAAYVYIITIIFLFLWIERKNFIGKLLLVVGVIGIVTIFTFTYNDGNNLVHDLILLRLEVEDGEMEGDNRVTNTFEDEYDAYIGTSDIVFGRDLIVTEFGNAGYRVFIYEHGIVGLILIIAVYVLSMMYSRDTRVILSVMFLSFLFFMVSAFMLWENIYFPLYAAAYLLISKNRELESDTLIPPEQPSSAENS